MGVNWIETALAAVYFAIMARRLGPALYGHWAYGLAAYVLLLGVLGFGLDALTMLRFGRDRADAGAFVGLMLTLRLALLGFGACALAAYAVFAEPDPLGRLVLLLLVPAVVGRGVAMSVRVCFLAHEQMADYAAVTALFRGAEAAGGILYLLAGGGLVGVVVLHSLVWCSEAVLGLRLIGSRLTPYAFRAAWRPARRLLGEGAVLGLGTAAFTWLASGPIVMLRHSAVGMAAIGQFAIVSSLTMILVTSACGLLGAALPVLRRRAWAADAACTYGRLLALAIIAAAAIAATLAWAAGAPAAEAVLGARYATAGGLLAPFALIGGIVLAPIGYSQMLLLRGERWMLALADLAAALCLGAAMAPAVAAGGLNGAVLALAGAWLVRAALLVGCGEAQRAAAGRLRAVPGRSR